MRQKTKNKSNNGAFLAIVFANPVRKLVPCASTVFDTTVVENLSLMIFISPI